MNAYQIPKGGAPDHAFPLYSWPLPPWPQPPAPGPCDSAIWEPGFTRQGVPDGVANTVWDDFA